MSYKNLIEFEDIVDSKKRLVSYSKHYIKLNINGLHYVNFHKETGTISISHPNHRTHHLATSFLLRDKELKSINTIRGYAYNLKLFLDFLMIWDIDLLECDLMYLLTAFSSYLMCTEEDPCPKRFTSTSYFYSTLKKIPLNDSTIGSGKVARIGFNSQGFKESKDWHCRSYNSSKVILSTAIKYLTFLREKTYQYKDLKLNELPMIAVKAKHSIEAGTLGDGTVNRVNINYLLKQAGYHINPHEEYLNRSITDVMLMKEGNALINSIPSSSYQNRLLFTILKCFGLRRGEACNIKVDTSKLSPNLMYLDKDDAIKDLKQNLKGDIEFINLSDEDENEAKRWVCHVTKSDSINYDTQSKTGARTVPLVLSVGEFEEALLYGLIDRKIIMSSSKKKHNYLLVCRGNVSETRGNPITGSAISKRFSDLTSKLKKDTGLDLTRFSPHDFRHCYATFLIASKKYAIFDVSKLLGHKNIETTIQRYYHFIKSDLLEDAGDEVLKIYNKYKEMEEKSYEFTMD